MKSFPEVKEALLNQTEIYNAAEITRGLAIILHTAPAAKTTGGREAKRGKIWVHFMANKKLKCHLHMASLTAIKLDADLKAYNERKVAVGKPKMSVLNAVKCKLLARVVAVVNKGEIYVNNRLEKSTKNGLVLLYKSTV